MNNEHRHRPDADGVRVRVLPGGPPAPRVGNAHAAVVALERARALEPDKGSVRETLGRAYFRTGRFADAEAEFAGAVELDPVNDYAHFGLGLCLLRDGRPGAVPAGRSSWRWPCGPTSPTTRPRWPTVAGDAPATGRRR